MVMRCEECGFEGGGVRKTTVAVIRDSPAEISRVVWLSDLGGGDGLRSRPAAGVWSPLEYIAHTGDAIAWYAARVDRVLTERCAVLSSFDWDGYTARQCYHDRDLDDVLIELNDTCASFADILSQLTDEDWEKSGIGSDGGRRSVADLAVRAAHEAWHHRLDVRNGLEVR